MSSDDPFLGSKEDLSLSLQKARAFFQQFTELLADTSNLNTDKLDWTATELRNSLRSVDWDIEDLDQTISITESNQKKIKISDTELNNLKQFVRDVKNEANLMKEKLNEYKNSNSGVGGGKFLTQEKRLQQQPQQQSILNTTNLSFSSAVGVTGSAKYTKLQNQYESPRKMMNNNLNDDDLTINVVGENNRLDNNSTPKIYQPQSNLTSQTIKMIATNNVVDEHAIMLDDNEHDVIVESKLKKVARVLHLTSGRQPWATIGIVCSIVFLAFIAFMAL